MIIIGSSETASGRSVILSSRIPRIPSASTRIPHTSSRGTINQENPSLSLHFRMGRSLLQIPPPISPFFLRFHALYIRYAPYTAMIMSSIKNMPPVSIMMHSSLRILFTKSRYNLRVSSVSYHQLILLISRGEYPICCLNRRL